MCFSKQFSFKAATSLLRSAYWDVHHVSGSMSIISLFLKKKKRKKLESDFLSDCLRSGLLDADVLVIIFIEKSVSVSCDSEAR